MKTYFEDRGYLKIDLSDESPEISDYVIDQLPDRLDELQEEMHEIKADNEDQWVVVSVPIFDLILKIIEEKENDIRYETKHGYRGSVQSVRKQE